MPGRKDSELYGQSLYLIDGTALFYRAYYAFIRNPLINSKGENTSATYGVVNSLVKIIRDEKPDYMAVIFDTKHPTFRHKMYADYKATRPKMPDDMAGQLPRVHESVQALNLYEYELEGFEADDIMATLAVQAAGSGMKVNLVSSDKDLYQVIDGDIRMYLPQKGSEPPAVMDREAVKKKTGVYPAEIIDLMALTGDSSDNIPGIPGIGPKTALTLLEQFGTLDNILEQADRITAKGTRTKVLENKDLALTSRILVTLDTNVPHGIDLRDLRLSKPDSERCRQLFTELELFSILRELFGEANRSNGKARKSSYQRVSSLSALKTLVKKFAAAKEIAFDTETDSLDSLKARLVGLSLSIKAGEAYYIPVGHTEQPELNLPVDEVIRLLSSILDNDKVQKIAHNFKYDLQVMENEGITVSPISFDTMMASYVLNPSARGHSLGNLAIEHFGHQMIPITELIGSGKKQISFAKVDPDRATEYSAEDADYTYRLRGIFAPLIEEKKLARVYYDIEMPLIPVLSRMERTGVKIDTEYLAQLSRQMEKDLDGIAGAIYSMAGHEFNINSTQQLARILFEKLKLPTRGKTAKKTAFSTDVRVLEELSKVHPLPRAILEYRQLTKLKSTYVDAIPNLVKPETGRVHTSFNQAVTTTGRLSSTDPNLQNIPVRTESGREIRKAFIPGGNDMALMVADYSQVELRILAHFSQDDNLVASFHRGEDIHARTAAEVFGVPIDTITPEQRRAAKTANFAVIYGVSAYGLSQQTELNMTESRDFIETYFARYPGIKRYIDSTIARAREDGQVTTLLGRRRYLPDMHSKNSQVRQFAERTAINTPIQGTAADIIKLAMIAIDRDLAGMKSRMILQVHDELVFDAHVDELDRLRTLVRKHMSEAVKLIVPLVIDIGVGPNWLEAK